MNDWNDLRYLLAIARHQTLTGAARELGVNQTTVGRRLAALEHGLGAPLFERSDQRWVATPAGKVAVRRAEQMEREALGTSAEIAGQDKTLEGLVRVTSVSVIINPMLIPKIRPLLQKYPNIDLELMDTYRNLDLAGLEVDIAIRMARPAVPGAINVPLGTVPYHVYADQRFAGDAENLPWIGLPKELDAIPESRWLTRTLAGQRPALRGSNGNIISAMLKEVPSRALMPRPRAYNNPNLIVISGPKPVIQREVWLGYMKSYADTARIQAVVQWIRDACQPHLDPASYPATKNPVRI